MKAPVLVFWKPEFASRGVKPELPVPMLPKPGFITSWSRHLPNPVFRSPELKPLCLEFNTHVLKSVAEPKVVACVPKQVAAAHVPEAGVGEARVPENRCWCLS